jgi:trehalose-6-phosphate synthase
VDGNEVCITSIHKGVDIARLYEICDHPNFPAKVARWRERLGNRMVIAGIRQVANPYIVLESRLAGCEIFLSADAESKRNVVLVMVSLQKHTESAMYRKSIGKVTGWSEAMNAHHQSEVSLLMDISTADFTLSERLAFFACVDVFGHTAVE